MTKVYDYIGKGLETNIPKVLDFMDKVFKPEEFKPQRDMIREIINDPDNCWNKYLMGLWSDVDPGVLYRLLGSRIREPA